MTESVSTTGLETTRRESATRIAAALALTALVMTQPAAAVDDSDNPSQPSGIGGPSAVVNTTPFGTDTVSTGSGAISIVLPLGQTYRVGGDLSYGLSLTYTSAVWQFSEVVIPLMCYEGCNPNSYLAGSAKPMPHFNAGLGWYLGLGQLGAPTTSNPYWVYIASDGSRHKFFDEIHKDAPADGSNNHFYTRDGSYLRLRKANSGLPSRIEFPNGSMHEFDSSGRVAVMKDRYGNQVTVTYSSDNKDWWLSDGMRTQHIRFVNYGSQYGNKVVDYIELTAFDGTPAVYDFSYQAVDIRRTCLDTDPQNDSGAQEGWVPVLFLSHITGPEGIVWDFRGPSGVKYHKGAKRSSSQCSFSGVLEQMQYPTGGTVNWSYQSWHFPATGFPWVDEAPGVSTRTQSSELAAEPTATWTFNPDLKPYIGEVWTDVTDPVGNKTRYFSYIPLPNNPGKLNADYGLPISKTTANTIGNLHATRELRDASGQLVRRDFVDFAADPLSASWVGADRILTNRRVVQSRTIFSNDGDRYIDTVFSDYDGLGHYRRATTTDSWSSAPARSTQVEWNPASGCYSNCPGGSSPFSTPATGAPWLPSTYAFARQEENGVVARQEATFDSTTGALASTRMFRDFGYASADPAPSEHDVVTRICRDASGNLASVRRYGGDTQTLTGAAINCATTDDSVYRTHYETQYGVSRRAFLTDAGGVSIGFDLFTATIDPNTGQAREVCDSNGLCRTYTYDDLGRLKRVEDSPSVPAAVRRVTTDYSYAFDGSSEGGWSTTVSYSCPTGGLAPCTAAELPSSVSYFGGFGRPYKSKVRNADSTWSKQVALFDAAGRTLRQTTWIPELADPLTSASTLFSGHDVYGRPSSITLPDGKVQTQTFTGFRQRDRFAPVATALDGTETVFRTTEIYDRNGRLIQLDEPAMAGGAYASAAYTYNVLGGLFRIVHTAGSDVQQRTWVYDARGFLVSESSPERVSLVELGNYDAGGNAGSRTVAGNTLDFAFDRAGRLLTVTRPLGGGGNELLQQFAYDTAPGYGLGRIASATDWTRFTAAAIAEAQVTESFEYSGVGGNASLKTTTVALDATTAASTTQSYLWSASGAIADLGYPAGMSAGDPARTVTHQYTNGFLTAIPGFAASFTYHDNLALASVAHTNGVTDWIGQGPSRMLRPAALWTSGVAGGEDWNSGAYGYDGSGNIRAIGGQRYRYDGVSRLVQAELRIPETNATLFGVESFTYDAYGNLTSRDTTEGGSTTTVNSPADPATNRLTGATSYDTEGNLTSWNGAQYGFDPLGRMVRMQNGAEDWLFAYSTGGERVLQVAQAGAGEKRWTVRDVGGRVLREWTEASGGSPVWDRDWVYRGGQLLATVDATTTRHLTLDHLGTPRLVTDQSGAKLAFHAYWPYGREATDPNQDSLRKKFTGHERDEFGTSSTADDLDYMHARLASPQYGRFLTLDSHRSDTRALQSWNRYAYVSGGPVTLVDPNGQAAFLAVLATAGAGGGLNVAAYSFINYGTGTNYDLGTAFWTGVPSGLGVWGGPVVSAIGSAATDLLNQVFVEQSEDVDWGRTIAVGGVALVFGPWGRQAEDELVTMGFRIKELAKTGEYIGKVGQALLGAAFADVASLSDAYQMWSGHSLFVSSADSCPAVGVDCSITVTASAPNCGLFGCTDLSRMQGAGGSPQGWSVVGMPHPFNSVLSPRTLGWSMAGAAYHYGDFSTVYDMFSAGSVCIEGVCSSGGYKY